MTQSVTDFDLERAIEFCSEHSLLLRFSSGVEIVVSSEVWIDWARTDAKQFTVHCRNGRPLTTRDSAECRRNIRRLEKTLCYSLRGELEKSIRTTPLGSEVLRVGVIPHSEEMLLSAVATCFAAGCLYVCEEPCEENEHVTLVRGIVYDRAI